MRIIQYLKNAKLAVFLIICLLVVQAFTDLALPTYTANIVDVGIQQSGIHDSIPRALRADTFNKLTLLVSDDDEQLMRSAYRYSNDPEDVSAALPMLDSFDDTQDTYAVLENDLDDEQLSRLNDVLAKPMMVLGYAAQIPGFDLNKVIEAYRSSSITKAQILEGVDAALTSMPDMGDSIIEQQAIASVKSEYEAMGVDLASMQMEYLFGLGLQMVGITILGMIASILIGFIASRTGAKIGRMLRGRLFNRVVSFSDAEVQSFSAASLITRGTNDIQQIQGVTVMLLRLVLYSPILAIGGIVMISRTNLSMSWIIVVAVAALISMVAVLMKVAMPKFKLMQVLIDKVNLVSREILTGLPVIRAFGRQDFEEKRFDAASTNLFKTQLFTNRVMTFMMPLMMLLMNGMSVLIVWVGASYISAGTIQVGDMIAFITYAMVIVMSFLMLSMISIMLPRADVAAQRINEVLAKQPSIVDPENPQDKKLNAQDGVTIAFDHVGFAYGETAENVLTDISFVAPAGKTTAFIGSTGCGKSTILKLMERFYDVTEGSVQVNGIDVRNLSQHALRSCTAYIPQQSFLFAGTVETNVAYSNESMPNTMVKQALSIAQAEDFVAKLPEGVDSPISQGGTNVSGGQRQRLAIARALASDAQAFLFDDSFSALDYATDASLRHALETQLSDRTLIIVAQRVSTIMQADNIIVLDDGRIVGQGTHEQLLSSCSVYREIAESQLSAQELGGGDVA